MASKRKSLCIEEKVRLILAIEDGEKQSDVGRRFGLSHSTVATIWKSKEKILKAKLDGKPGGKKLRKPKFEDLDQAMLSWFNNQFQNNAPLSGPIVKAKAEKFAKQLGITDFKASEGWHQKFKNRHNISYGKMRVQNEDKDNQEVTNDKMKENEGEEDQTYGKMNVQNENEDNQILINGKMIKNEDEDDRALNYDEIKTQNEDDDNQTLINGNMIKYKDEDDQALNYDEIKTQNEDEDKQTLINGKMIKYEDEVDQALNYDEIKTQNEDDDNQTLINGKMLKYEDEVDQALNYDKIKTQNEDDDNQTLINVKIIDEDEDDQTHSNNKMKVQSEDEDEEDDSEPPPTIEQAMDAVKLLERFFFFNKNERKTLIKYVKKHKKNTGITKDVRQS